MAVVVIFPFAFAEQGVAMLSSVLSSERAVQVNIAILRAFVRLREAIATNQDLAKKFEALEKRVGTHDSQIKSIMDAIREMIATPSTNPPRREIGFHVKDSTDRSRTASRE